MKKIKELLFKSPLFKRGTSDIYRKGGVLIAVFRNPGIIVGGLMIVFLSAYIFRDKMPFFSATGNDPVVYWSFDEGTGTTAYDTVGSNDGSFGSGNSAPSWVSGDQCVSGKCLRFDGTNDYIQVPANATIGNLTSNFTVGAWFKSNNLTGAQRIVGSYRGTTDDGFALGTSDTNLFLTTYSVKDYTSTKITLSTNRWYYVAAVMDSSFDVTFYVNGEQIETVTHTVAGNTNTDDAIYIGAGGNLGPSQYFKGDIDEVKVYDYARTAAQIKTDFAARGTVNGVAASFGDANIGQKLSSGLVGYWKMDESVGSTGASWAALDSSGNNYTGVGVSDAGPAAGKFGNGGSFDGTDDYLRTSMTSTEVDATNEITINVWFKGDALGSLDEIVAQSQIQGRLGINSGNNEELSANIRINSSVTSVTGSTPLSSNTWYMGTFTVKSGVLKLYVNGVLDGQNMVAGAGDINIGGGTWNIARGAVSDRYFDGIIDEVRFYNRALDPSEVKALYNFAPGPVAHWKMDEASGTSIKDVSGNGNNSSAWAGNTKWTNGKYGAATEHDGNGDRITISSSTSLDYQSSYTWSFWVNPAAGGSYQILDKAVDTNDGWTVSTNQSKYQLVINYTGTDLSCNVPAANMTVNTWQYITWTWDGTNTCSGIKFYKNGNLVSFEATISSTGSRENDTGKNILIGGNGYTDYQGKIDDIKIYNYVRTPSQIIEDMNAGHPAVGTPIGSTVLHLKLDEGYGTTTDDWSPQSNDASLGTGSSAPAWTNDGKFKKALSFDGSSDYLSMPDSSSLDFNDQDFSISGWFYRDTATTDDMILAKRNGNAAGNQGYMVWVDDTTDKIDFEISDATDEYDMLSSSTFTTPGWNHFVVVWDDDDASNSEIYVNGKDDDAVDTGTIANIGDLSNGNQTHLGNVSDNVSALNVDYFDGKLDEIKVYPFALTADQVKTDYNQGKTQTLGARSTGVGGTAPDNSAARAYCVPGDTATCSAPVGEWKFDQSVGSSAPDTSTNGNIGALNGSMTDSDWVAGKFGNALDFDGVDDRISIPDNDIFSFGNGTTDSPFSISVWVNLRETTTFGIVSKRDANDTAEYTLSVESNQLIFTLWDDSAVLSTDSIQTQYAVDSSYLNKWTYIVATYDGSSTAAGLNIYINNQLVSSSDYQGGGYVAMVNDTATLEIGRRSVSNSFAANGKIDQVRIYNYVRTPAQIAWEYSKGAPVAYYKLNECSGSTANDWAPNANGGVNGNSGIINIGSTGTQTSAGTCVSGDAAHAWNNGATGKYNGSLNFDGSDDYVTVADNSLFDFTENNDFSISAWVKPANITANHAVFVKKTGNGAGAAGYMTYINNQGKIATYISDGTDQVNKFSKDLVSAGTWSHIVMVYKDDTSVTMYINGNDAGGTIAGTIANVDDVINDLAFAIGGESDRDMPMEGQIDEIKVFNYALTQKQIQTEFASGAVRFE